MPATIDRADLKFDWKEVNCFLRPQAILCERIAAHHGLLYLFLSSLYQACAFRGFRAEPVSDYFDRAKALFREALKLDFQLATVRQRADIMPLLEELLRDAGPLMAPVNLRPLPYYKHFQQRDQTHYLIMTGCHEAGRVFTILDNLHVRADNESDVYADESLSRRVLEDLVGRYYDLPAASADTAPGGSLPYWVLRIRPDAGFRRRTEGEAYRLMFSEYLRLANEFGGDATRRPDVDGCYLTQLRLTHEQEGVSALRSSLPSYLAACNFATVHLKIAAHVLRRFDESAGLALLRQLDQYKSETACSRSRLLVKCMAMRDVPGWEWEETSAGLSLLASRLREHFASRVVEISGATGCFDSRAYNLPGGGEDEQPR